MGLDSTPVPTGVVRISTNENQKRGLCGLTRLLDDDGFGVRDKSESMISPLLLDMPRQEVTAQQTIQIWVLQNCKNIHSEAQCQFRSLFQGHPANCLETNGLKSLQ